MKDIFTSAETNEIINRINKLTPETKPQWGKMSVSQMLAHCNVTYEMAVDNKYTKAGGLKKFLLKLFIKPVVVNEKPYKRNSRTAPEFLVNDDKDFATEKNRLINYLQKTQQMGRSHFEGKDSNSFGPLTAQEWNNMFYKHLDHHLTQFGV